MLDPVTLVLLLLLAGLFVIANNVPVPKDPAEEERTSRQKLYESKAKDTILEFLDSQKKKKGKK